MEQLEQPRRSSNKYNIPDSRHGKYLEKILLHTRFRYTIRQLLDTNNDHLLQNKAHGCTILGDLA